MKISGFMLAACMMILAGCGDKSSVDDSSSSELDQEISTLVTAQDLSVDRSLYPTILDPQAQLGKALFFSRTLSGDNDVACASCHHPALAGADSLSLSVGVQAAHINQLGAGRTIFSNKNVDAVAGDGPNVPRNAPTTFNVALYNRSMFHDGRLFVLDAEKKPNGQGQAMRSPESLKASQDDNATDNLVAAQAKFPVTSLFEMRGYGGFSGLNNQGTRTAIEKRLQGNSAWVAAFRKVFDPANNEAIDSLISYRRIALALGEYQRSQILVDNSFNKYLHGNKSALSESAKKGAVLFFRSQEQGGAGCSSCHSGANFSNEKFFVSGFPQIGRGKNTDQQDFGRREVTQDDNDRFRFRVPTLLNVARTAPYGHAGTFDTLEQVITYHLDPAKGADAFDYTLQGLNQFKGLSVRYPNASKNTHAAVAAFLASDSKPLLYNPSMSAESIVYLADFLRSLTDGCLDSPACMSKWVAQAGSVADAGDDPDGNMLLACFSGLPDSQQACTGENMGVAGSGALNGPPNTGGGTGGGGIPTGSAVKNAFIASLDACENNISTAPNAGLNAFKKMTNVQSGLNTAQSFSDAVWLENKNYLIEYFLVSGGFAVDDFNADCWPDLLFVQGSSGNNLYAGNKSTSYSLHLSVPMLSSGIGVADLDGDYKTDVVVGGYAKSGLSTSLLFGKNAWPAFTPILGADAGISYKRNTMGIAFGDYNMDGWPDIVFGMWSVVFNAAPDSHLWKNSGAFGFSAAEAEAGIKGLTNVNDFTFSPSINDVSNDGRPDFLMTGDFENTQYYVQKPDGLFEKKTDRAIISDQNGMGSVLADFDNDGDLDWFVTAIYSKTFVTNNFGVSGNRFYKNAGDGSFVDGTDVAGVRDGAWGWGACAADFDNDGDLDIFQVNGYGVPDYVRILTGNAVGIELDASGLFNSPARLFVNNGNGVFTNEAPAWSVDDHGMGRGVSCVDIDRDGDVDLVIANFLEKPVIYLNDTGAGRDRKFLSVRLVGTSPGTEALGARIYVTVNGVTQMREVSRSTNYMSNNPLEQHFGLVDASTVETLRIVWPRTRVETVLHNVPVNQFLVIGEP